MFNQNQTNSNNKGNNLGMSAIESKAEVYELIKMLNKRSEELVLEVKSKNNFEIRRIK